MNNNEQQELLTITIDIGNGQQENIEVFEGDSPYNLAQIFAMKHGLDLRLTDLLASQIQSNIDQVMIERARQDEDDEDQIQRDDQEVIEQQEELEEDDIN